MRAGQDFCTGVMWARTHLAYTPKFSDGDETGEFLTNLQLNLFPYCSVYNSCHNIYFIPKHVSIRHCIFYFECSWFGRDSQINDLFRIVFHMNNDGCTISARSWFQDCGAGVHQPTISTQISSNFIVDQNKLDFQLAKNLWKVYNFRISQLSWYREKV